MESVTGRRAWQRGGRLHLHGRDVQQGVAEARPVVGGVHTQDAPRLSCGNHSSRRLLDGHLKMKMLSMSNEKQSLCGPDAISSTCALELASPHAFSRGRTLGAVGGLAAGLSAVTGQEDLSLVDPAVMFRCAANGAADAGPLWTVCAPFTLQSRLENPIEGRF